VPPSLEEAMDRAKALGFACIGYTSRNHKATTNNERVGWIAMRWSPEGPIPWCAGAGYPFRMVDGSSICERYAAVSRDLNERTRRLFGAAEARTAGHGGITASSRATGLARSTIGRGLKDLDDPGSLVGRFGGQAAAAQL
jgi:hypothetical protein